MMNSFQRISLVAILCAISSSCVRTAEPDSTFVATEGLQLKVDGQVVLTYDPLTWQLGYNATEIEFRASDDSMKEYFFVTCSKLPSSLGQKLDATVTWSSGGAAKSLKGRFEVAKVEGDIYWLWCGEKKIRTGVTVRILR